MVGKPTWQELWIPELLNGSTSEEKEISHTEVIAHPNKVIDGNVTE